MERLESCSNFYNSGEKGDLPLEPSVESTAALLIRNQAFLEMERLVLWVGMVDRNGNVAIPSSRVNFWDPEFNPLTSAKYEDWEIIFGTSQKQGVHIENRYGEKFKTRQKIAAFMNLLMRYRGMVLSPSEVGEFLRPGKSCDESYVNVLKKSLGEVFQTNALTKSNQVRTFWGKGVGWGEEDRKMFTKVGLIDSDELELSRRSGVLRLVNGGGQVKLTPEEIKVWGLLAYEEGLNQELSFFKNSINFRLSLGKSFDNLRVTRGKMIKKIITELTSEGETSGGDQGGKLKFYKPPLTPNELMVLSEVMSFPQVEIEFKRITETLSKKRLVELRLEDCLDKIQVKLKESFPKIENFLVVDWKRCVVLWGAD